MQKNIENKLKSEKKSYSILLVIEKDPLRNPIVPRAMVIANSTSVETNISWYYQRKIEKKIVSNDSI